MKITFYPTKEVILGKMGFRLTEIQGRLGTAKEKLGVLQLRAKEAVLHNPYADQELLTASRIVEELTNEEAEAQDLIGLLESATEDTLIGAEAEI